MTDAFEILTGLCLVAIGFFAGASFECIRCRRIVRRLRKMMDPAHD